MKETIINYSSNQKSNWFKNKINGLINRYFKYKRILLWKFHCLFFRISIDKDKVLIDSVPVFINNFNRYTPLRFQIEWLNSLEDKVSIIIVDNNSDYTPLLDYYKSLDFKNVQVVYLGFNSWLNGVGFLIKKLHAPKYVVTDSDLLPYPETPRNLISYLSCLLDKYPNYNHIGLSLEINDIPDSNPLKERILNHEGQYWEPNALKMNNEVFIAAIDSTFAMYRRTSNFFLRYPALRTDRPYTLKHLDWYLDKEHSNEEMAFYLKTCKPFATWAAEGKRNNL